MKPDTSYRTGTLRRPTNIDGMYPQPTQPLQMAQSYKYELWKQLGKAIGLVGVIWVLTWVVPALMETYK